MHAAGFPGGPDSKEPKSIQATTVISRLRRIIEAFTAAREDDATILTALRNRELHTSEAVLASIDIALWLPRFTRVARRHLAASDRMQVTAGSGSGTIARAH